jgi:hypothetical protein
MKPEPHPQPPKTSTREPQYQRSIDLVSQKGLTTFAS